MAMTVKNNLSATRTINVLNRNSKVVQKNLRQAASGMKIVDAQDDASAYAISERMRVKIRALDQANRNVQNGSSLLKIAEGGINNIVEELRSLKELAINAANDTNTDEDRRIIQKEFLQRMDTINDIATTTAYNGKTLLDGTHAKKVVTYETAPTIISAGDYTISQDGIYFLADGYTGTITVEAQNVKLMQQTPATQLENVSIIGPSGGNANLWIEDLNIKNTQNKNIIKFQGADNYLSVKGTNTFNNYQSGNASAINIGRDTKIIGDGFLTVVGSQNGTAIGSDYNQSVGDLTIAENVTVNASRGGFGAAIGSAYRGYVRSIKIGGNANVTAISDGESPAGIGSGWHSSMGIIEIGGNAKVTARAYNGAGIGACPSSSVGSITISSSATVNAVSTNGEAIGRGITYRSGGGEPGIVGTISIGEKEFDIDDIIPQIEPDNTFSEVFLNELRIQSGDNANHAMNIFIDDMHTKSLGTGKLFDYFGKPINGSDLARYNALNYDSKKQAEWLATLKAAENKTLDNISVTTRENANIAIRVIDGAIEYALDQATNVGAYLSRLEYTADNVTTSADNVQASESTIRDADMAKTMTDYTKNNVLIQTAQAMLAQSNQNSNFVLGLLR